MGLKRTIINVFILGTCLTICFMLFSLKNRNNSVKMYHKNIKLPQKLKKFKLFNLDFKYLINNNVCAAANEINAVFIVTSYYGNVELRSAMRRALPDRILRQEKLRRVFLLAIGPNKGIFDVNYKAILQENGRFGDLVQGNFIEAYRNLTYKHIMGLNWAATYCSNAKYVVKMDDDTVFNAHKLKNLLSSLQVQEKDHLLAGYILQGMVPIRESANKWYVTKKEYENSMYPPFLSGWFYITTPQTAEKLVKLSSNSAYFWIDDVYVTGILAQGLKIKHYALNNIFAVHAEYLQCCIRDVKRYNYKCEFLVGSNGGDNNLFYYFNKIMEKCEKVKCVSKPTDRNLNNTCVAERKIRVGKGAAIIEKVHLF